MKTLLVTVSEITINHLKTGNNIRKAREKSGISLRSLAEEVGIESSTLSRLERGCGEWTKELVAKIDVALNGK